MKFTHILIFFSIPFGLLSQDLATEPLQLKATANLLVGHLLHAPKYMMYETDFLHSIHYAEVCTAYGAINYARTVSDKNLQQNILDRYEAIESDSISWQNHHVDGNVYGVLPFKFYQLTGNSSYLDHGLYLADSQWKNPLADGMTPQTRYWIDDVFMVASLQIEAYRSTGEEKYLNRAASFTANYIDSLQQQNGLFYHGPDAPVFWGRGNGWMAAGIAMTLSELPENHPEYDVISKGYYKMVNSLTTYQKSNGMWKQIIDHPNAWEEPSGTAMFAYAMSIGISLDLLTEDKFHGAVANATNALLTYVNEQGAVRDVCAGTGQSADPNYYLNRPRVNGDFHGQAPLLWLIESLLRD